MIFYMPGISYINPYFRAPSFNHLILYYIIWSYIILYYIILYYVILYYIMLYPIYIYLYIYISIYLYIYISLYLYIYLYIYLYFYLYIYVSCSFLSNPQVRSSRDMMLREETMFNTYVLQKYTPSPLKWAGDQLNHQAMKI